MMLTQVLHRPPTLTATAKKTSSSTYGSGKGIWAFENNSTWTKIDATQNPTLLASTDLDGNGQKDLIFDYGSAGIWAFENNAAWAKIDYANNQTLIAATDLDGDGKKDLVFDYGFRKGHLGIRG